MACLVLQESSSDEEQAKEELLDTLQEGLWVFLERVGSTALLLLMKWFFESKRGSLCENYLLSLSDASRVKAHT